MLKRVNGTAVATFIWDGANLLAELNGSATAKVAEYSYYPGLDNLHALVVGTTRYYAHADGLGNVIALTDESKVLQRTYGYTDWGVGSGTDIKPFSGADRARWKGALWLGPEAELYYMRNRWYEPHTGRFLSEDPIGLEGGINPVVFAGADPVNGVDPLGLEGCLHRGDCHPLRLATLEVWAFPWPFATPRELGHTARFGQRGSGALGTGGGEAGQDRRGGGRGNAGAAPKPVNHSPGPSCATLAGEILLSATLDVATMGWGKLVVFTLKGMKAGTTTYEGYVAAKSFGVLFKGSKDAYGAISAIQSPDLLEMSKSLPYGVGTVIGLFEFGSRCL